MDVAMMGRGVGVGVGVAGAGGSMIDEADVVVTPAVT